MDSYACVDVGDTGADNCEVVDGEAHLEQIGSVTTHDTVDDGSAFGRVHTYEFDWTPGEESPITGQDWEAGVTTAGTDADLYAVGVNADGDALVTPVNDLIEFID